MFITKQGAKYEYKCVDCGNDYIEQRNLDEQQFFTECQVCRGKFELVKTTEFQYKQEIPDQIITE